VEIEISVTQNQERVVIHTDGGCVPNPGVGGWGAVLEFKGKRRELSGGADETTNNRMEMTAAIEALETLKRPCRVLLYTDSEYLRKGITEWLVRWKRNGWKTRSGPVKNVDLWKRLELALAQHHVEWHWVRGHTGVPENERCDQLALVEITRRRGALNR
jgi:ribonuclease HI